MFLKKPDLTSGSRPTLLPDETLLFVQDSVGLYEDKFKVATCQKGHAYLTSHRACYVDDIDPRNNSLAVDLKDIERYEIQPGFLRSSPKITLHPKQPKRGYGALRQHVGPQSPLVQRLSSASSPVSRMPSPSPARMASPQVSIGTWICPICAFSNSVPSNFDPTIATEAFPLLPCLTCGIKPPYALVLKASIAANSKRNTGSQTGLNNQPLRDGPLINGPISGRTQSSTNTIECPRCTFHNHTSLNTCEICGAPLPSALIHPGQSRLPSRSDSPGPEIADLNLEDEYEHASIKFSFRAGGDKVFFERLKNAIIQRKWLLYNAPPAPRPDLTVVAQNELPSSRPHTPVSSQPQRMAVGIAGLEQRGLQSRRNNETVLGNAFSDLEALMASAKDIVALAERFATESGTTSDNPLLSESATALGMIATKDMVGDNSNSLYITELSRNLAEYVTDERRGILRANGGIIGLVDLWATINRSRNGVELISPADFHNAAEAWDRLSLPVRLRQFKSGLLVVQLRNWNDDKTIAQIKGWLQSLQKFPPEAAPSWDWTGFGCGVTAQEAASRFNWSIGVANEELEMAEEHGALCREEGIEGLKFWLNYLTKDDEHTDHNSL